MSIDMQKGSVIYAALLAVVVVMIIAPAGFLLYIYHTVTLEAEGRIERGAIDTILASESPVYYDDGTTPIGVFFDRTHRRHIRYKDIPKVFIKAIVAAEDRRFFEHRGIDLKAVLRAMITNIKTGGVVQGGSTITQQAAKNIFEREKRSYQAKLKELCQAFLLERNYSKEEILEMYVNQFFVTGYGKGLSIAAQYFFDKEAEDLDLVEAAFIAGSLKAPNRYNPFTKTTGESRQRALRLAKDRKNYVLSAMHGLNFISSAQYDEASGHEVPFRQGRISYSLSVPMDYVRSQLESEPFREILEEQGVENIATSGISIHTSINEHLQKRAVESLREHLPRLDVQLRGYKPGEDPELSGAAATPPQGPARSGLPFPAVVTDLNPQRADAVVAVGWENGGGILDFEAVRAIGEAWIKWKKGPWAEFSAKDLSEFLSGIRTGQKVWVRYIDLENGRSKLVLTEKPQLEGAAVVLHRGMIKAMAGGFHDRFFNRAVDARRQLGSIFKPLVYSAALQLKWNSLDPIPNRPDLYRFQTTNYAPRPDHRPETEEVSVAWAGVKSENMASVKLLYDLTDRLNLREFESVARSVGLARTEEESYEEYVERIRDRHGVIVNEESIRAAAFEEAKLKVRSEVIFAGYRHVESLLETLGRIHYRIEDSGLNKDERKALQQVLPLDFTRMESCNRRMKKLRASGMIDTTGVPGSAGRFYLVDGQSRHGDIAYIEDMKLAADASYTPFPFTPPPGGDNREIWIDGHLPSEVLDALARHTAAAVENLKARPGYSIEVLRNIRDFKTLLNIRYATHLARRMGIHTEMEPALSFPLGAHSISILEAAQTYQTMMTGKRPLLFPDYPHLVPVITCIVDRAGETIWEYQPSAERVLSDEVSSQIMEILRLVVTRGTGRRAEGAVRFHLAADPGSGITIPVYGKTGTANRFMNSSFVGCIPGPDPRTGILTLSEGYAIASYVGYDDNRPMASPRFSVYGATGALPVWIDTANAAVAGSGWRDTFRPADLVFSSSNPHIYGGILKEAAVSPKSGLPETPGIPFHALMEGSGSRRVPIRLFEPIEGTQ